MNAKLGLTLLIALTPLCADTLWDQQPNPQLQSLINQEFSDLPAYSTYAVDDITVGGVWDINSITEYFTTGAAWPSSFDVRLNIFSDVGAAPLSTDDPTTCASYLASFGSDGTVTVSGLSITLDPGNYWIGFTPEVPLADRQNYMDEALSNVGNPTAFLNPGDGFQLGTAWMTDQAFGLPGNGNDYAITITGTQGSSTPEPSSIALVAGGFGSLLYFRRRR